MRKREERDENPQMDKIGLMNSQQMGEQMSKTRPLQTIRLVQSVRPEELGICPTCEGSSEQMSKSHLKSMGLFRHPCF